MAFQLGQSGNPSGRPKENTEVKTLARSHCRAAVEKLVALMGSDDEKTALAAANSVLDRGIGKPAQVVIGDDDEPAVKFTGVLTLVRPKEGE